MTKKVSKRSKHEKVYVLLYKESPNDPLQVIAAATDGKKVLREAKKLVKDDQKTRPNNSGVGMLIFVNGRRLGLGHDCIEVAVDTEPSSRCVFGFRLLD